MKKIVMKRTLASLLFVLGISNISAQELSLRGVGGRLSLVDVEGPIGATVGFGGHADLGELFQNVRLYPNVEFWSRSGASHFTINGDVRYYFPRRENL